MKRYELITDESGTYMVEDPEGEYVRFEDIQAGVTLNRPIGEQIALDAARDLDGVASHIMAGESLNYEAARVITRGARMIERLTRKAAA